MSSLKTFNDIHSHFWGKDRIVHGKDYSTINITPFKYVMLQPCFAQILLVREEYEEAYNTILTDTLLREKRNNVSVFLVTGQPGIGKTLFLLYTLIRRLQEQKPVAIQIDTDFFALFQEGGASEHPNSIKSAQVIPEGAWALSDSPGDESVVGPCDAFKAGQSHVIHTSSPASHRWKHWVKQLRARRFIMNVWSLDELKILITLSGFDAQLGEVLFMKYGPSPRIIVQILDDSTFEEQYVYDIEAAAKKLAEEFQSVLQAMDSLDFSSDISSKIFTVMPAPTSRRLPILSIPTEFLCNMVSLAAFSEVAAQQHKFFLLLSSHPTLATPKGWLFESYAHLQFSDPERQPFQAFLLNEKNPHSIPPPSKIISGTTELTNIQPPFFFYWRPRDPHFPGVDALIRSDNVVWALQFTISACHSSATEGLEKIWKLMRHKANVDWRVVMVGPDLRKAELARDRQTLDDRWKNTPVYACQLPLGQFEKQNTSEQKRLEDNLIQAYLQGERVDEDVPMDEP